MINYLFSFLENGNCVSIYCDFEDTSKFVYGKILYVDSDFFVVLMIAPNGMYDGILVKQITDIVRVEADDKYSKRMSLLMAENRINMDNIVFDKTGLKESVLRFAKAFKKIVSFELINSKNDDVVGFVEVIDEGCCKIKQVDFYGHEDGYSFIELENITQISVDSRDEQIVLRLWELN